MWWLFVVEYTHATASHGRHCEFRLRRLNHESLPHRRRSELATHRHGDWRCEYECYVVDFALRHRLWNHCFGHRTLHRAKCGADTRNGNDHRHIGSRQFGESIDHSYRCAQ